MVDQLLKFLFTFTIFVTHIHPGERSPPLLFPFCSSSSYFHFEFPGNNFILLLVFFLFFFVCADGFCLLLLLFSFPSSACRSTPRSLGGLRPWRLECLWKTCLASCLTVRSSQRKFLTKVMKISRETKAKEASDNWRLFSVNHRTQERTVTADWTFTDGDDRLRWLGFRDNWISEAVASETGKTSPNLFVSRSQRSLAIERETI